MPEPIEYTGYRINEHTDRSKAMLLVRIIFNEPQHSCSHSNFGSKSLTVHVVAAWCITAHIRRLDSQVVQDNARQTLHKQRNSGLTCTLDISFRLQTIGSGFYFHHLDCETNAVAVV